LALLEIGLTTVEDEPDVALGLPQLHLGLVGIDHAAGHEPPEDGLGRPGVVAGHHQL
jgi:hypothetical protein